MSSKHRFLFNTQKKWFWVWFFLHTKTYISNSTQWSAKKSVYFHESHIETLWNSLK